MTSKAHDDIGFSEDSLGVPSFEGGPTPSGTYAGNPYEHMAALFRASDAPAAREVLDRSRDVYDDLMMARAIALSIFGRQWAEHVIDVYDRLSKKGEL